MRTLLIDEYDLCRDGMKILLQDTFQEATVSEACSIDAGLKLLSDQHHDLIMVDLDSRSLSASEVIDRIMTAAGNTPVIAMAQVFPPLVTSYAIEKGVSACLNKLTQKKNAKLILQLVMAGGRYFPPEILAESLADTQEQVQACPVKYDRDSCPLINQDRPLIAPRLTRRQLQVLKSIAEGKSNKVIAREMNITAGTVKVHVAAILKTLKASNRTQAVNIATHMKLI
ncbi:LuxR C-terminal-related transcriptional regulator [Luteithermobacter gelatinilyticus]|uniref:LuxR C-terminal-related transcriptional regulator n=1 Tax=Luteithermobacter gelatinilyticus TaxID=2582913 RepID=UPI0011069F51|nr:response regulator transcription factor [Luteithermobacter gelatinilyticus]